MNNYYPYQYQQNANPWLMQGPQQPQQIQNGGFVVVHTEDEAMRYPVAPGNSVTFKVENQPIVIEKTMGFSQLESPRIERFRLVREDAVAKREAPPEARYALAEDVEALRREMEELKKGVEDAKLRRVHEQVPAIQKPNAGAEP